MALPKLERGPPARFGGAKQHAAPETINLETHEFILPQRAVLHPPDILKWEKSKAFHDLYGFIMVINGAVRNKKLTSEYHVSENVKQICAILEEMDNWIDEIPPIDQPQRFGNKAFRDWFDRLQEKSEELVRKAIGDKYPEGAAREIAVYLVESVGNKTRIDYGTGHEMAFIFFLCCLFKIGFLEKEDYVATVFNIFNSYLRLARKLQLVYRMEPAGSHGSFSLDDFQFIPFIWGSAQLIDQGIIETRCIPDPAATAKLAPDYIFFQCVQFINSVKTGPFAEHSNVLWGISAVPLWSKVNSGLVKMYKAEVTPKFPVIQHVLFGSLMSIAPVT